MDIFEKLIRLAQAQPFKFDQVDQTIIDGLVKNLDAEFNSFSSAMGAGFSIKTDKGAVYVPQTIPDEGIKPNYKDLANVENFLAFAKNNRISYNGKPLVVGKLADYPEVKKALVDSGQLLAKSSDFISLGDDDARYTVWNNQFKVNVPAVKHYLESLFFAANKSKDQWFSMLTKHLIVLAKNPMPSGLGITIAAEGQQENQEQNIDNVVIDVVPNVIFPGGDLSRIGDVQLLGRDLENANVFFQFLSRNNIGTIVNEDQVKASRINEQNVSGVLQWLLRRAEAGKATNRETSKAYAQLLNKLSLEITQKPLTTSVTSGPMQGIPGTDPTAQVSTDSVMSKLAPKAPLSRDEIDLNNIHSFLNNIRAWLIPALVRAKSRGADGSKFKYDPNAAYSKDSAEKGSTNVIDNAWKFNDALSVALRKEYGNLGQENSNEYGALSDADIQNIETKLVGDVDSAMTTLNTITPNLRDIIPNAAVLSTAMSVEDAMRTFGMRDSSAPNNVVYDVSQRLFSLLTLVFGIVQVIYRRSPTFIQSQMDALNFWTPLKLQIRLR